MSIKDSACCPHCGRYAAVTDALAAVDYRPDSWAGSPAPWLSGPYLALLDLKEAGLATRTPSGWWVPTAAFPHP